MRRYHVRSASLLAILWVCGLCAGAQVVTEGILAPETPWSTPYYIVDSGVPGPKLMVIGGVHGDEPAGAAAANELKAIVLQRGALVLLPQANQPGLKKNSRYMPDVPKADGNLNRNFPKNSEDVPHGELARTIWQFVTSHRPEILVDLHESRDFGNVNDEAVGNSIIAADVGEAERLAGRMIAAINEGIAEDLKRFRLRGPPVSGSVARSASDLLRIPTMIVETARKDQPLALRVEQHLAGMRRILTDLKMTPSTDPIAVETRKVRVAVFDGHGAAGSHESVMRVLSARKDMSCSYVGAIEVRNGFLKGYDVIVFPGGSGSDQAEGLREAGRKTVRAFVEDGGGYLGICAGAYLASDNYVWSLKILDANVVDRSHWQRGTGTVEIELTGEGLELLRGNPGRLPIRYANVPLYEPANDPEVPDMTSLALFQTAMTQNGDKPESMIGRTAIACGTFGRGRVACSSPHPEREGSGLNSFVYRLVYWAAKVEAQVNPAGCRGAAWIDAACACAVSTGPGGRP